MASQNIYSPDVSSILTSLGGRIQLARRRRKIRQTDLADRSGLSRSTIQAIEQGEASVAIGAYVTVLWVLGLANELNLIADPGLDRDGLNLSVDSVSKRVFIPRKIDNDF